jgi:membrane peptidoglycan carboxypeptidase
MVTPRSGYAGVTGAGRLISHLVTFIVISALAGVLIAGLTLPFVGTVGLAAKSASDQFLDLPDDFQTPVLPQRTTIRADNGSVIAYTWGNFGNRVVVPMADINQDMPHALVAIEDMRYYQHGGIDIKGTVRAMLEDEQSDADVQGGSSIAQQYVKNVLLLEAGTNPAAQQAAIADTFSRKITELKYAIAVEQDLTKDQILERYLNLVYFGNNAYGVEAAAEEYFSTTADKLTVPQAALLAAIVNSPTEYNPFEYPKAALARRNIVLQKMADPSLNYITPAQAAQLEKTPLGLHPTTPLNGCITAAGSATFFCNYVYESFLLDPTYGKTEADRQAMWNLGGLNIVTTMDPTDEAASSKAISAHTYPGDKVASALAMIQPGTGEIKAIAQSKSMGSGRNQTYQDLAADDLHNGGQGFQAGSTFKIFVGLAALEDGVDPNQVIVAPETLTTLLGHHIPACANGESYIIWDDGKNGSKAYTPTNDDGATQSVNMAQAYWYSVNNYFTQMEGTTGLCVPAEIAQSMGVTLDNDTDVGAPLLQIPSFTLGTNYVTPIAMASAYATLAAQGTYCEPYVIVSVSDASGKQYGGQTRVCRQVIAPNLTNEITSMLQGVLTQPGATAAGDGIGRPAAGKTGTTTSSIATWFDGYTPQLATAVWTGFISPTKNERMENLRIGPTYWSGQVYGADVSAPTWQEAMEGATAGMPVEYFTPPTGFAPAPPKPPTTGATSGAGGGNGNNNGNNNGGGNNGNGNGGGGGNGGFGPLQ